MHISLLLLLTRINYLLPNMISSVLVLLSVVFVAAGGEYYIKERQVPSYMFAKFNHVEEETFPREITIKMSIVRVAGTLLYSMDSNLNQLILTLYDSLEVTLGVEINMQAFGVSLPQLCGCKRCRFETFELKISLGDHLDLQCDGGAVKSIRYNRTKALNEDYPLPYNHTRSDLSSRNEAHLWLVNQPQFGHKYPNSKQLSGCIFHVSYLGRELPFTKVSENIGRKCRKICDGDICNGGRCYETFNGEPVCNCTTTFNNGPYCNESIHSLNIRTTGLDIHFEMFKLSWKSSSSVIFSLENEHVGLRLYRSSASLMLEYKTHQKVAATTTSTLYELYNPARRHILIATFHHPVINVQVSDDVNHFQSTMWTGRDLGLEVFTSLMLHSGRGKIDMAFKMSHRDYLWNQIPLRAPFKPDEEDASATKPTTAIPDVPRWHPAATIAIGAVCFVLGGLCFLVFKMLIIKRGKQGRPGPATETSRDPEEVAEDPTEDTDHDRFLFRNGSDCRIERQRTTT